MPHPPNAPDVAKHTPPCPGPLHPHTLLPPTNALGCLPLPLCPMPPPQPGADLSLELLPAVTLPPGAVPLAEALPLEPSEAALRPESDDLFFPAPSTGGPPTTTALPAFLPGGGHHTGTSWVGLLGGAGRPVQFQSSSASPLVAFGHWLDCHTATHHQVPNLILPMFCTE